MQSDRNNRKRGFTMVELLVALAVAGVLLSIGVPAFNGFMDQQRMTATINDMVVAVNYARSEAAKIGGTVSIRAIDSSDDDNEWGPGFCVAVGTPANCNGTLLRRFPPLTGFTMDGTGTLDTVGILSFNSRGLLTGIAPGAASVQLCSTDNTVDPGRQMGLSAIGRTTTTDLVCYP